MNASSSPEEIIILSSCESSSDEEMTEDVPSRGKGYGIPPSTNILQEVLEIVHWLNGKSLANPIEKEMIQEKLEVQFEVIHKRIHDQDEELKRAHAENSLLRRKIEFSQHQLVEQQQKLETMKCSRQKKDDGSKAGDITLRALSESVMELQTSFGILIEALNSRGRYACPPPWARDVSEMQHEVGQLLTQAQGKLTRWVRNQTEMRKELEQTKHVLQSFMKQLSSVNAPVPGYPYTTLRASVTVSPMGNLPPTLHIPSPPPPPAAELPPVKPPSHATTATRQAQHPLNMFPPTQYLPTEVRHQASSFRIASLLSTQESVAEPVPHASVKVGTSPPDVSQQRRYSCIVPAPTVPPAKIAATFQEVKRTPIPVPLLPHPSLNYDLPPLSTTVVFPPGKMVKSFILNKTFSPAVSTPSSVPHRAKESPPPNENAVLATTTFNFKCEDCGEMFATLVQLRLHSKVIQ